MQPQSATEYQPLPPSVILSESRGAAESKFCEADILQHMAAKCSGTKPPQAGSAMGFLKVCLAFELLLICVDPCLLILTAHNQMQLLQAACQKPAQIPLRA